MDWYLWVLCVFGAVTGVILFLILIGCVSYVWHRNREKAIDDYGMEKEQKICDCGKEEPHSLNFSPYEEDQEPRLRTIAEYEKYSKPFVKKPPQN